MSAVENNMEIQLDHQATEESRLCKATPYTELIEQLMNPCVPKTEREHAAVNEIERLVVEALGANVLHDAEKHMHEKTRKELSRQIDDLKRLWSIVAWRYRPTIGEVDRWRLTEVPPWKWGTTLAIEYEALYAKRKTEDVPTSADVIAGLEMALSQAAAMIERQQTVMQRAIEAWDCTTHQKNGDGRLWQCMEELRGECGTQPNQ